MEKQVTFWQYWQLLVHYLRPQKGRVTLLSLLILGGISLQLVNPQLVRRFLDSVETGRSLNELLNTAVFFMLIAMAAQLLKLASTYVGEYVAWSATNELRADLALHCLQLDMSFHKVHKPGELIERVDGDVNQLANFFSQLIIQLVSNFLLLAGVLILLWWVDWRVGATISAIGLVGMLLLNWLNKRIVPRWQTLRQVESDLFGYLEEWLSGTEEIQTNRAAPYIMRHLYQLLRQRWQALMAAMQLNLFVMSLPILVPTLAYIVAYLWGNQLFRNGVLTIGSVYLIFYYIDVIKNPLWVIQRQVQDLQRAAASMNRIIALFAQQPTIQDGAKRPLRAGPLAVQFDNVTFAYNDMPETEAGMVTPVLRHVSFTLAPGTVLGLLGRTGSGKTTITRLLLRFYDPTTGAIRLGDENGRFVDLRDTWQANLRQRIGMVTQDVELFHASVRDNLTLFDDKMDDKHILNALDKLALTPWLENLPNGLDTHLDGSDALSAGEAQLLALARVFLGDPGLVILDEASSRLDPATEQLLERAIDRLLAGRTAIIIAHRLGTVQRADEIMILADGEILEHDQRILLSHTPSSHFYQLLQTGLEELIT